MQQSFIAVLMGSDSDLPKVQAAIDTLKQLNIPFEVKIHSAHRTFEATHQYVTDADKRGCAAFICCAGMAAHLAGVVASLTIKPVIGVPIDSGPLQGMDALLSTAQMPSGIPVATVSIGKSGAKNAAYLAAQILALSSQTLQQRLLEDRKEQAARLLGKDQALQEQLNS